MRASVVGREPLPEAVGVGLMATGIVGVTRSPVVTAGGSWDEGAALFAGR